MKIAYLRKIPYLRNLKPKDLRRILKIAQVREFRKGEHIFSKADLADHMFIVLAGQVKIYTRSGGRKRKTFAYLGPGRFFGEMALLEKKARSASALCMADCRVLTIHKKDFKQVLTSDAKLTYYVLRTVSERLRRANEDIENLLFRNILGRVCKALYDLASESGQRSNGGLLLPDRLTHQELADLVGTTREPLSRALSVLRRSEMVQTRGGRIFIREPKRMEALITPVSV